MKKKFYIILISILIAIAFNTPAAARRLLLTGLGSSQATPKEAAGVAPLPGDGKIRAKTTVVVNETATRAKVVNGTCVVLLGMANPTNRSQEAQVKLEILDPQGKVLAQARKSQSIHAGRTSIKVNVPLPFGKTLGVKELLTWRLHYRLSSKGSPAVCEGIIALGWETNQEEIEPPIFLNSDGLKSKPSKAGSKAPSRSACRRTPRRFAQ